MSAMHVAAPVHACPEGNAARLQLPSTHWPPGATGHVVSGAMLATLQAWATAASADSEVVPPLLLLLEHATPATTVAIEATTAVTSTRAMRLMIPGS